MYLLPNEVWCRILQFLDTKSRNEAKLVCKLWLDLIKNDPKPKHLIFDNLMQRYDADENSGEFDWNYKWILTLRIISERPKVKICEFKSYGRCQFYGNGFEVFVHKAKLLNVEKFLLEGRVSNLVEHLLPNWPEWMVVSRLELESFLINWENILEMTAYLPGRRSLNPELAYVWDDSISEESFSELTTILPKLSNLQECRIYFESCDIILTTDKLMGLVSSIPKTHLKYLKITSPFISDVTDKEFEETFVPSIKSKFLPSTDIEFNNSQFKL